MNDRLGVMRNNTPQVLARFTIFLKNPQFVYNLKKNRHIMDTADAENDWNKYLMTIKLILFRGSVCH